jgi:hypothetical protein
MPEQIDVKLTDKQIIDFLSGREIPPGFKLDIGQRLQWETLRAMRAINSQLRWLLIFIVIVVIFEVGSILIH